MKDQQSDSPIQLALLIDDEAIDQKMYMRIMERSGVVGRIMGFLAADHALDYLKSNPDQAVDAIFLDINMPRMDGFEFLEAATAALGPSFAKVCIVMLTTSLDPYDHERAAAFEVVKDFINKPLTIDVIHHVAELVRQTANGKG
ncbi:response regulator [Sulfitobacter sp. JBTF-M27]|uniref:Response regulator n=1 Tax=Sulfitobacter sediminilitoris TaxID=2698830 RepID=A0A6P0C944_9RHOB|nr:response regulator [Sulfitobacter sediminilitoris]NEK22387.1 response regulator [Sulfitobacter sediminilitoris]